METFDAVELSNLEKARQRMKRTSLSNLIVALVLVLAPGIATSQIIWNGDFSTGNFLQYHTNTDRFLVKFTPVPPYGRPIQYGAQASGHVGNGHVLSLVSVDGRTVGGINYPKGPTRGSSPFAAKFTIKNSANGVEPADCDPTPKDTCTRRRAVLKQQAMHPDMYDALPHMGERWVSFSVYIPTDFPSMGADGVLLFGIKMKNDSYAPTGYFNIGIDRDAWRVKHGWSGETSISAGTQPWQYMMMYAGDYDGKPYPRSDSWPEGQKDFPDVQASHAALKSLRKGAWTDWILHYKQDHRGSDQGGTGFLKLWKREDTSGWTQVLNILPKQTTRGGITFNHGIGYNLSAFTGSSAGAGTIIGPYGKKAAFWDKPTNSVLYYANHKVGSQHAKFSDMSPDGSLPGTDSAKPAPPWNLKTE